ncbi:hypothetical protein [Coleofasciculus sp. FACHB-SPT36]|uniref:hypothetical protein n=1 Tax=Cyanophyceae TaxID=3028117 RepID=UPI00168BA01E|nr:hypothetical protein [Coleofasciculus sp. FACHB-SPT36]MBD2537995.1 hypothetical protein [Coleofasciculus sp. FACHB-SPT36]
MQGIPARTAITALSHPTLDFGFQVLNGTSLFSNDFQQFTCGDIQVKWSQNLLEALFILAKPNLCIAVIPLQGFAYLPLRRLLTFGKYSKQAGLISRLAKSIRIDISAKKNLLMILAVK